MCTSMKPSRRPISPLSLSATTTSSSSPKDLLVDWPRNKNQSTTVKKNVQFSESATLRVYSIDPSYEPNKSYTKADRKEFGRRTLYEVARIRNILKTLPKKTTSASATTATDDNSTADNSRSCSSSSIKEIVMKGHLESYGITQESITGIEHLALESSPTQVIKTRQLHTRAILLEQEKQRILGMSDEERLAHLSVVASKRVVMKARIRAGVAA